jgi:ABC-2 type transport system permease protein
VNLTLRGFLKKELIQTLRDKRMKIVMFLVPLIQLTVFGLALSNEVRNIRIASFFAPSDRVGQRIVRNALASGWFIPAGGNGGPFETVRSGNAHVALVPPPGGLTRGIERGDGRLQLLIDASNAVRARSIEAYLQAIVADTLAQENGGPPPAPLTFDLRVLYNPSMDTSIFLVPGVMVMILTLLTIIVTSMAIAREREMGALEVLISAPIRKWELLLGKTLPYVIVAMADVPLILAAGWLLFGVPVRGSILLLLVASFFFVCTAVAVGTVISTFARNQQQAMMGGMIFMMPAILLSGIMYPLETMPKAIGWLAALDPLSHFVTLLRNILLKGGAADVVAIHLAALAALAAAAIAASARRFHSTLN